MAKKVFALGIVALAFIAAVSGTPTRSAVPNFNVYLGNIGPRPQAYVVDRVLVQFAPGVSAAAANGVARGVGGVISGVGYGGAFHILSVPVGSVWNVVTALSHNPNIVYAEPDWIATASFVPNDPLYSPYQWHLDNPQYGGIEAEQAWNLSLGGSSTVKVAVVDTGVAYENFGAYCKAPDLAGTNFVAGYDFINNDAHANDDNSHGTHVTGTIAQTTNNGLGVAGIAFNTTIMPVKVLDASGSGPISAIANGIRFAADNGAKVINMSLGTNAPKVFLTTLESAVKYADGKGVFIVCATGNAGTKKIDCPACYAESFAVGASGYDDTRAYYSSYGSGIDITAPGGNDRTDLNGDTFPDMVLQNTFNPNTHNPCDFAYWFFEGTSMATPHVSGTAALLFARGAASASRVRTLLQSTAEDKGAAGYDTTYGYGIVNAAAAVAAAP